MALDFGDKQVRFATGLTSLGKFKLSERFSCDVRFVFKFFANWLLIIRKNSISIRLFTFALLPVGCRRYIANIAG